ncbi:MAG: Lrp/AsnC ligand binding domain-containing protein [Nitrososphaera sp.]|nr:Lrp/AsnC ligand binding domain-containing protein [Nitrososphaera sp.]
MPLAFVFVECKEGQALTVKKLAEQINGVQEAHSTTGSRFDVVVKVRAKDEQNLHGVLSALRRLGGIAALATSIVCKSLY